MIGSHHGHWTLSHTPDEHNQGVACLARMTRISYRASSAYYASTKPCSPRRQTEGRRTAKDPERGSGLSKCHASSGSPLHHASSRRVVGLWKRRERGSSTPAGSTDVSSRDSSFCPVKCGFVARCQSDAEFVSRLWASCGGGCCPPASQEKERQPFIQNARSAPVFRRLRIRTHILAFVTASQCLCVFANSDLSSPSLKMGSTTTRSFPPGIHAPSLTWFKNDANQELDWDLQKKHIEFLISSGLDGGMCAISVEFVQLLT